MRALPSFPTTGRRAWLSAAILGALSAAALPPFHVLPVLLLAVPGLLILVDAARSWRQAAWIGFWFGFGHHLVGLYWITDAILVEAARFWWLVPLAVPALSAALALFIALACGVARCARPDGRAPSPSPAPGRSPISRGNSSGRASPGTRGAASGRSPASSARCFSSPSPGSARPG